MLVPFISLLWVNKTIDRKIGQAYIRNSSELSLAHIAERKKEIVLSAISALVILLSSALWIYALVILGLSFEAMPWYITLAITAVAAACHVTRYILSFESTFIGQENKEPMGFFASFASTYFISSLLFLGFAYLFVFKPVVPVAAQKQIVDIEFVSNNDFINNHDPLSSTKQYKVLRKRAADMTTQQGSLTEPVRRPVKASLVNQTQLQKKSEAKQEQITKPIENAGHLVSLVPSVAWQAHFPKPKKTQNNNTDSYMEEVAPPEMVEIMENDGDKDSTNVFQKGGHSSGGTGSKNELALYLKELQRRIKLAWSPPKGQSRQAQILFRIRRNGKLAFMRLVQSSSDSGTDEAAMNAIAQSCSNRPLPASFSHDYLDLLYKFTYTVDELQEIPNASK
jgi:outer membrane biosynthesis protein TonB